MSGNSFRSLVLIAILSGLFCFASPFLSPQPAFPETPKASTSINQKETSAWREVWPLIIAGIVIALFSSTLGFAAAQYHALKERERDRRERAEALKASFWGEINSNRRLLGKAARDAFGAWEGGEGLSGYILDCPKVIYKANAGRLGDLRDAVLVKQIVNFYSFIELWEAKGKELQRGATSSRAFTEFVSLLVDAFDICVILDMQLSKHTEHLKGEGLPVVVSPEDVTDRDFCLEARSRLRERLETLE